MSRLHGIPWRWKFPLRCNRFRFLRITHYKMDQELIHLVHFFFRNTVRWHEIYRVPQRPQIDTPCERIPGDGRPDRVDIFVAAGIDLECQDRTQRPGVASDGVGAKRLQKGLVPPCDAVDVLTEFFLLNQIEAGQGRGAGERVGRKRMPVKKGLSFVVAKKGLEKAFGRGCYPERHRSSGESLT